MDNSDGSRISQKVGTNFKGGGGQLIIWPFFFESCIKMKEIGPRGEIVPRAPLDLPTQPYMC